METEQGACPNCGSHNVDFGLIVDSDDVYYPGRCLDCGSLFREYYQLKYSGSEICDSEDDGWEPIQQKKFENE